MSFVRKLAVISLSSLALALWFVPSAASAANVGELLNFYVNSQFDAYSRTQLPAVLVKTSPSLYFYVEKAWWESQTPAKQSEIVSSFDMLSGEFAGNIYPTLTSVFGSEWKPGVDGDAKITLLFHAMGEGAAGYFRSADEHIKLQTSDSNEREMMYLSLAHIDSLQLKVFVAHEFVHLITFNQKERLRGVQEEIWLNEARAEYASTILGYNDPYLGSNLQKRVKDFVQNSYDPLTEWQEKKQDYAAANVFVHYMIDHYGINILSDSLQTKTVGISGINEALLKNGFQENFSQIFTDWTIATVVNDCSLGLKYCYLNKHLKSLRINPTLNFLPLVGNSSLSVSNVTKNWTGNWQKIIGGNGGLKLEFSSLKGLEFKVPYLIFDKDNNAFLQEMQLDQNQKGSIEIERFSDLYNSLVLIPSLQTKSSGFDGVEFTYPYTFTISFFSDILEEDPLLIQKLLAQIDYLKQQIAAIQARNGNNGNACNSIDRNLYVGVADQGAVRCLQNFLKGQGAGIYPEGLVTGNFARLTKAAVIRFQQRHGIPKTGFLGPLTRGKINQLISTQ